MKRFRNLSIRTKFTLSFITAGILIVITALMVVYSLIAADLSRLENYYLENEFHSIHTLINYEQEVLLRDVKDYANWDDMYNYVNTHDEQWVKTNVTERVPKNFKVDLILIFDAKGNLIYEYGNFEEFQMGKDLSNHPLIKEAFEARETKGLYSTSKGIIFLGSSQIMHTDESGPRNGTYLYGKLINAERLARFKAITGMDLSLISKGEIINSTFVGYIDRPGNFEDIYKDLSTKKFREFNIYKPNFQFAFVYSILKDVQGKDIGMLELIRPRKTVTIFRGFFIKSPIWIIISVILAVFVIVLVITNIILRPLNILRKTIEEIQKTKDMLKRVKVESGDEFGILAKSFNVMMDALNKSQNELMQTHQDLIKSEKMATAAELAMGTVHQINNPLSIVIGRIQMLRRLLGYKTPIPEADLEKDLKIIEEQTRRAVDITNSLLRYAAPITLRFERCNINELLKDALSLLEVQLQAEKIEVIENLKPDLPPVEYCDVQQMRDVFMNVIMNAQQAMPGGGRFEINTDYDEKEDTVVIKFIDNGCGIPPENIEKLFTPFFSTRADKSGLGLAISYNIVKGHRGTIEVESQVSKGSTFTVKLPVGGGLKNIG